MLNMYQHIPMKNSMEKQIALAHFIKGQVQPSLGIIGILRESFKTTIRNGRIVLFITLIMFSYYSLVGLADHIVLEPVLKDMVAKSKIIPKDVKISKADPTLYKAITKDVRYFLSYELIVLSFSCLVLIFSLAASVHSTYEAYTGKVLSLKDMLLGTKGRLKRTLITSFWTILISLASAALLFFVAVVVGIMIEGSLLTAADWTMLILGVFYFVYICALWMLSLVVSVVEENLSGLKAIGKANELMKGKRLKGSILMAILMLAIGAIYLTFYLLASNKARFVHLAISIPKIWSFSLMKLLAFVVFTLFYHECKKSHPVEENPNMYAPVSAVEF